MPVSGIDRLQGIDGTKAARSAVERPAPPASLTETIGAFADPARTARFAVPAVAATAVIYAYAPVFGPVAGLCAAAIWLPLVPFRRDLVHPTRIEALVWLVPLFALASALWSNAPEITAFAAVELAVTVACAHVAARTVTVDSLFKGLLAGAIAVSVVAVAVAVAPGPIWGGGRPLGPASPVSGFVASLGVLAGLSLLVPLRLRGRWALAAMLGTAACAAAIGTGASTMTLLALATALTTMVALTAMRTLAATKRRILAPLVLAMVLAVAIAAPHLGALDPARQSLLWSVGMKAAGGHPLVGYGYQGFWADAHAPAERLREVFGDAGNSAAHFHNLWVETLVEGGVVGLAIVAAVFLAGLIATGRRLFGGRVSRRAVALAGLLALFLVRSASEVDHFRPNSVATFVLIASLILVPAIGTAVPSRPLIKRRRARVLRARVASAPPVPRADASRAAGGQNVNSTAKPSPRRWRGPPPTRRRDKARPEFRPK